MAQAALVRSLGDLRPEEVSAIKELQERAENEVDMKIFSLFKIHDWLRAAWCRSLDAENACEVLKYHGEWIERYDLRSISSGEIRENFKAGFSVKAGRDFDGRPLLWQRMQFMTPSSIPLPVGIKSTWLALDAALADLESNRIGVCLVYDFTNVGLRNISLNVFDVRDGSLACGAGHPSHISRVLFLNPPFVFKLGYNAAKPLLPSSVTNLVTMINIKEDNMNSWYSDLCAQDQLPEYLGGCQTGDYFDWLTERLKGSHLMYHDAPEFSISDNIPS